MTQILWTSGWDSTFRVAQLLLIENKDVEPIYIIDDKRKSYKMELQTIEKLRKEFIKKDHTVKDRLKELKIYYKKDIPKHEKITQMYINLKAKDDLGSQNDWLARFTYFNDYENLEMSTHKDDNAQLFLVNDIITDSEGNHILNVDNLSNTNLLLFKNFNFPLIYLTKIDMQDIAEEMGFLDILNKTWFCHKPVKGEPCGLCTPCKTTIEEGLGRRVPKAKSSVKLYRSFRGIIGKSLRMLKII